MEYKGLQHLSPVHSILTKAVTSATVTFWKRCFEVIMQASALTPREQAEEYWWAGRSHQAGNLLYDAMPAKDRPAWAARILRLILKRSGLEASDFLEVLRIADDPTQWGNARKRLPI